MTRVSHSLSPIRLAPVLQRAPLFLLALIRPPIHSYLFAWDLSPGRHLSLGTNLGTPTEARPSSMVQGPGFPIVYPRGTRLGTRLSLNSTCLPPVATAKILKRLSTKSESMKIAARRPLLAFVLCKMILIVLAIGVYIDMRREIE